MTQLHHVTPTESLTKTLADPKRQASQISALHWADQSRPAPVVNDLRPRQSKPQRVDRASDGHRRRAMGPSRSRSQDSFPALHQLLIIDVFFGCSFLDPFSDFCGRSTVDSFPHRSTYGTYGTGINIQVFFISIHVSRTTPNHHYYAHVPLILWHDWWAPMYLCHCMDGCFIN